MLLLIATKISVLFASVTAGETVTVLAATFAASEQTPYGIVPCDAAGSVIVLFSAAVALPFASKVMQGTEKESA